MLVAHNFRFEGICVQPVVKAKWNYLSGMK